MSKDNAKDRADFPRRRFLKLTGATAGAAALPISQVDAASSDSITTQSISNPDSSSTYYVGSPSAKPGSAGAGEIYFDRYTGAKWYYDGGWKQINSVTNGHEINVITEGADPGGSNSFIDTLESIVQDEPNPQIFVPEGNYRIDRAFNYTDFDHFSLVGEPGTRFVVDSGYTGTVFNLGSTNGGKVLRLSDFVIDVSASNCGPRPLAAFAQEHLELRNITLEGRLDADPDSNNIIYPAVTTERGYGRIENLRMPDGSQKFASSLTNNPTAISIEGSHVGTLEIVGSYIARFPNNGIYAKRNATRKGQVNIHDCFLRNVGLTSLRLNDEDTATNCRILYDDNIAESWSSQALWPQKGGTFRNIEITNNYSNNSMIRGTESEEGAELYNITVNIGSGVTSPAILQRDGIDTGPLYINGLVVRDDVSDGSFVITFNHSRVTIVNSEIDTNRRGIYVASAADDFKMENVSIDGDATTVVGLNGDRSTILNNTVRGGRIAVNGVAHTQVEWNDADVDDNSTPSSTRVAHNYTSGASL
ncbi:twin-arginine translocation signal domain-containing protein [Haladaptatus sp. DYF46]|uniref:twin-arginine translocation signal domain-containing protein n=1 Tax=Haladaptatus sp. DYF46 TaxID=2886041 RepID=UPI001E4C58A3|nr:twin-arginine translocation signal domain-containing protein [Haladaptatus sp. DYF46]